MKVWVIMVDGEWDSIQDNKQSCIEKLCFWAMKWQMLKPLSTLAMDANGSK